MTIKIPQAILDIEAAVACHPLDISKFPKGFAIDSYFCSKTECYEIQSSITKIALYGDKPDPVYPGPEVKPTINMYHIRKHQAPICSEIVVPRNKWRMAQAMLGVSDFDWPRVFMLLFIRHVALPDLYREIRLPVSKPIGIPLNANFRDPWTPRMELAPVGG